MTAPVASSELGQCFWKNVRLGNIQCDFYEKDPSGPGWQLAAKDGTLMMGVYTPRPKHPLDGNCTREGEIRLRFRVNGGRPEVKRDCRVPWTYIGHGQNRDSMLGRIKQPWVLQILGLLQYLNIHPDERQSAKVLKCQEAANQGLELIRGVKPDWEDQTDQVHVIVKLHRILTRQEVNKGWVDGNKQDFMFLKARMYTKNWRAFPIPLAFNLGTLLTHPHSGPGEERALIRRSVLVTEAKGTGLHVGGFLNDRFRNTTRFPVQETIQIIFNVFKYVLKLQLDTLQSEGCLLGDLHEHNITVTWRSSVLGL